MKKLIDLLVRWCGHRRFTYHIILIGLLLSLPSLYTGWQTDDLMHRAGFLKPGQFPIMQDSPLEMFAFVRGDSEENRKLIDAGLLPWFASDRLRLSFFRPVTAFTHWIDYQLWPNSAVLMHLHSMIWYGALIGVVAILFRQFMSSLPAAGIAALFFAIDDGHALPVSWLANRNSVLATLFGALCLLSYHRWRSLGLRRWAVAAPLLLVVSLLSTEMGLATGGFLFSYAIFLDRANWRRRFAALLPCALVGCVWWYVYKEAGYGVSGSGAYIDPAENPVRFLAVMVKRFPLLVWGQFSFPPSDLSLILSREGVRIMWCVSTVFVFLLVASIQKLLIRDPLARFWALSILIALLPSCATWPSDRLLMLAGIGGMGLIAQTIVSWRAHSTAARSHGWFGSLNSGFCRLFLLVHLIVAPLYFIPSIFTFKELARIVDRASASLPYDPDVVNDQVFVLSAPFALLAPLGTAYQILQGKPVPKRTVMLCFSIGQVEVTRLDRRTITIRPDGGFMLPPGTSPDGNVALTPIIDAAHMFPMWDRLFWSPADPFKIGQRVRMSGLTITIESITVDGRPDTVQFEFDKPLEDEEYRWVTWDHGVYSKVNLPAVGESLIVERPKSEPHSRGFSFVPRVR